MSPLQKRVLRRFGACWVIGASLGVIVLLGPAGAYQLGLAVLQGEDDAVITVKSETETKTIKFTKGELEGEKLFDLVKERLATSAPDKKGCDNPRMISDDCWRCDGGRVVCTKHMKLKAMLSRLLGRG
jgi:hypothetical protein